WNCGTSAARVIFFGGWAKRRTGTREQANRAASLECMSDDASSWEAAQVGCKSLAEHGETEQSIARAHDQVLRAVEFISDGRVAQPGAQVSVPQQPTGGGIHGHQVIRWIARENEISGGG